MKYLTNIHDSIHESTEDMNGSFVNLDGKVNDEEFKGTKTGGSCGQPFKLQKCKDKDNLQRSHVL